ncbi:hypothetical protein J2S73_004019 [Amorphus orientalis]|uniref:Uncharacterized protein n=1 Tax=Amorphus orientalis TaxID=649198 RepID=A0AAE4AUL4_9HYPH|nr:hypothetical protein [Amorphus orientalis]
MAIDKKRGSRQARKRRSTLNAAKTGPKHMAWSQRGASEPCLAQAGKTGGK